MWDMGLKRCWRCKISYPRTTDYFYPIKKGDGLNRVCIECDKELQKKRRQQDPITRRIWARQYDLRVKKAGGVFTKQDIDDIYWKQNGKCAYCDKELNGKFSIDHILPVSRGGTNWPNNIALCCSSCNSSKNNKTIEEWKPPNGS